MRVPLSKIKTGLYTAGGEYTYKETKKPYKGYYYKIYGKAYAGKTYDPDAIPVELAPKIKSVNNPNSFLYNVLAGAQQAVSNPVPVKPTKSQALASIQAANQQGFIPVVGVNLEADNRAIQANAESVRVESTPTEEMRYFFRYLINIDLKTGPQFKIGEFPNEEAYKRVENDKRYNRATVREFKLPGEKPVLNEDDLKEAEKKIPGLKKFLGITD